MSEAMVLWGTGGTGAPPLGYDVPWEAGGTGRRRDQVLGHQARTIPDFPAITFEEETLSYRAFDRETNRIANELAAHGVGREDRVAVALKKCPESYLTFFAARKLG